MTMKTKLAIGFGTLCATIVGLAAIIFSIPSEGYRITASLLLLAGLAVGSWTVLSVIQRMRLGTKQVNHILKDMTSETMVSSFHLHTEEDEFGQLADTFREIAKNLFDKTDLEREMRQRMEQQAWVKTQVSSFMLQLQEYKDVDSVGRLVLNELVPLIGGSCGTFYTRESDHLRYAAGYAVEDDQLSGRIVRFGGGLVGQSALSKAPIILREIPDDYVKVASSLGKASPSHLVVHPLLYQEDVVAVIELASLRLFTDPELQLLDELCASLGILLNTIRDREQVESLLLETQSQEEELLQQSQELQAQNEELQMHSEELLNQQEAMKLSNEALEKQARALRESEEKLQQQQEELEESNQMLTVKARELESQIELTSKQKSDLEEQAARLASVSKYKSQFLANMSHELRTPLNSLLILSQLLQENKEGTLLPKQVEYARTIHMSGSDLLHLINEILDMSKIESGKMDLTFETVAFTGLKESIWRYFQPIAANKGLDFAIEIDPELPTSLTTDGYRLQQILRNLLSNAMKFTPTGSVLLKIDWAPPQSVGEGTIGSVERIAFTVKDTGIGIPKDKMSSIFEAFHQGDGTTSRKYGGTGLGLTISRELAQLIGGDIGLHSQEGKGSTFTLYLPFEHAIEQQNKQVAAASEAATTAANPLEVLLPPLGAPDSDLLAPSELCDDREDLTPKDLVLLVIEDDLQFARVLLDMARTRGFKVLAALQGDKGLALARTYLPAAIILDITLPVIDGWSVLNRLKNDPGTRHIPIHIISGIDEIQQGLSMGAIAYVKKPVDKEKLDKGFAKIESFLRNDVKQLLIVEDDEMLRESLVDLIAHKDVNITAVSTGGEALDALTDQPFDCLVLDLGLSDIAGFDLLEKIRLDASLRTLPIIIYTGKQLTKQEEVQLKKYADSIIIKNVKSQERLFDETSLFLHRIHAELPEDKQRMLEQLNNREKAFENKKILLVDDDIRNIFALSGLMEHYKMFISFAQNGKEAIHVLEQQPDIDLVLMDIMMPEMDGYEAMRHIRAQPAFESLPVIALTAKAMQEDRIKCLEAGANDFISKPINPDQLFSLLKVWLYK